MSTIKITDLNTDASLTNFEFNDVKGGGPHVRVFDGLSVAEVR